jgi:hypothetical protein
MEDVYHGLVLTYYVGLRVDIYLSSHFDLRETDVGRKLQIAEPVIWTLSSPSRKRPL